MTLQATLPSDYQNFIHLSRYSRWLDDKGRRETWDETVTRYMDFMKWHLKEKCNYVMPHNIYDEVKSYILQLKVMPSMRAMMTAGEALRRENLAAYNCAYQVIENIRSFDEMLYVLMNGVGEGFSVERQSITDLPVISETFHDTDTTILVSDSKKGWAKAYRELLSLLVSGQIPKWDVTKVRPKGAKLKTFGGRASGPGPLVSLFKYTVQVFKDAAGRKLNSLESHKICCKIADVVVVGGVRRAALLSLSNLSDDRMRHAKSGDWRIAFPELELSNNSAAYTEKPDMEKFMEEWLSLMVSKSGERGIFNRQAALKTIQGINDRAGFERREVDHDFGLNPCGEIFLRSKQLCNLSEVIVRVDDNVEDLKAKIRIATILGTWQASLTDFNYISAKWAKNCKEEALLGVSMTGIMDNTLTNGTAEGYSNLGYMLQELRTHATEINKKWAKKIGINQAAAITCVKPSGNISQLVDSASGIHARHSEYYMRYVKVSMNDPIAKFMIDKGIPYEPDVSKPNDHIAFKFPIKSPEGSIVRNDRSAIEQLEFWMVYKDNFCDHNPSCTINVKNNEWFDVGAWVIRHFDRISGIAFLPDMEHNYPQPPYQDCTKEEFKSADASMPKDLDWSDLRGFETEDNTEGSQTLACSSTQGCEM